MQDRSGVIDELIRERAYQISQRGDSGSAEENWQRAEVEIRAELEAEVIEPDDH